MRTKTIIISAVLLSALCGSTFAASKSDRFYVPQQDQSFEGKVKTRIGTLKFKNQYPSKESMETILDNMDFHGATQAYLWGIPIASFANLQYYLHQDFKFDQTEFFVFGTLEEKLGVLRCQALAVQQ